MDFNYQEMQQPPVKKSKTAIVIIVIVAFILLVAGGILAWILISSAKDKKSAQEVVEKTIEAYQDGDVSYLSKTTPEFLGVSKSDYEEVLSFMELLNAEYELVSMGKPELMDKDEISDLEDEIADEYDEDVEIEKACTMDTQVNITMSMMGVEETTEYESEFICIKLDGEWYLYSGF